MDELNAAVLKSIEKFSEYVHKSRKSKISRSKKSKRDLNTSSNNGSEKKNTEDKLKNENISFYQDLENKNIVFDTSGQDIQSISTVYKTCKIILIGESGKKIK